LARRSADERYDPLKLGGAKLRRDLIDAAVMEQEDSRHHVCRARRGRPSSGQRNFG